MTRHSFNWLFQRITGLLLFALLGLHFWKQHFYTTDSIIYRYLVVYFSPTLWTILEFAFLVFALYHALNGLWTIGTDYIRKPIYQKFLFIIIVIVAFAGLVKGYLIIF
jgi:succinate dehydrogenase hydrophobic membrane anchor protein